MLLGLHTGLGDVVAGPPLRRLQRLWAAAEDHGYDAVSVWDHFDAGGRPGGGPCFEAVSLQTALAMWTRTVRCGAFVYAAGHRPATVLAKAIATIDHVSGGRAEVGLGAGWSRPEHEAYGVPWGGSKFRLDRLEETLAVVTCMLRRGAASVEGDHVLARGAVCDPAPLQARIPVWVGGTGEKRTLRLVARWADGWNAGYLAPADVARKLAVLRAHCDAEGRDVSEIMVSVNVAAATSDEAFATAFRGVADRVAGGALIGTVARMAEQMAAFVDAGVDRVNVVVRTTGDDLSVVERAAAAARYV